MVPKQVILSLRKNKSTSRFFQYALNGSFQGGVPVAIDNDFSA